MNATSLAIEPALPLPLLIALGAAALLLLLFSVWKRARGWPWRALALIGLFGLLLQPSLVQDVRENLPDIAVIVADESESQALAGRAERRDEAVAALRERLGLEDNLTVEVVKAGGGGAAAAGGVEGTELFGPLEERLSALPRNQVGAVFLVSDGQIHDIPEAAAELAIEAPLHLLNSGEREEGDRRLEIVDAPSFGIVGKEQTLRLRIDDGGAGRGSARVTLRQDGGAPVTVSLPVDRDVQLPFTLDHRGETLFEIEVAPGERELTLANNRVVLGINGVRDRLRVLLVSGVPHAGERVWRNILKSDPAVDLVHFTILRPPEKQDGTPIHELSLIAFPTRELFSIKLNEFDLIIFDRYRRRNVLPRLYLDNIARFVEQGGALLESAGPAAASSRSLYATPLGGVMPSAPSGEIVERGFRPELTGQGRKHPVTANLSGAADGPDGEPSWGRWFRMVDAEVEEGQVLMEGPSGRPLLVLDRVGEGRVAQLLSDHVWLWARGFEGGGPQAELLRRVAHWLMQEPELEEEDLRATIAGDRLSIRRRSLDDEVGPVILEGPDGSRSEVVLSETSPGLWEAQVPIADSGLYRLEQGGLTSLAAAGPLDRIEFVDVAASHGPTAALIEETGGTQVWLSEEGLPDLRRVEPGERRSGNGWAGIVEHGSYRVTGISEQPFLPAWAWLLILLSAATVAWYREGR